MNPGGSRYYKLNLQNLLSGRQPTIEFRQHSATISLEKITNWIRFCVWMVVKSSQLRAPSSLAQGKSLDEQHSLLFEYAIKDRALRQFYKERKKEIEDNPAGNCCNRCARGATCQSVGNNVPPPVRTLHVGYAVIERNGPPPSK